MLCPPALVSPSAQWGSDTWAVSISLGAVMSQGWMERQEERGAGDLAGVLNSVRLFSVPEGPAAGSLSFLFQESGDISQVPTWGVSSRRWGRTQPLVRDKYSSCLCCQGWAHCPGPYWTRSSFHSWSVYVCVCVWVGRRASPSHVHRHAQVTCPYRSHECPPMSVCVVPSLQMLAPAMPRGRAGQGDNGDQCRHNFSSDFGGWRVKQRKLRSIYTRMMMCRRQERGEVASWLCKIWWSAKKSMTGPGKCQVQRP